MNAFLLSVVLAGAVVLAGCADSGGQRSAPARDDTVAPATNDLVSIRYEVGPCHGFCPVYSVEVRADGTTTFVGQQHTQVHGEQARQNGTQAFTRLQRTLAPWQPKMDQQRDSPGCGPRITDMSHYTVTWTGRDGHQARLLQDGGCRSASTLTLIRLLGEEIPDRLGISSWIGAPAMPPHAR